ncbi:MAG: glycosyltransferase family 4 protein [Nitrospirae bacterium]|nr:glycosyltransferase family 4 protein [Nitrospirota bacterium]
MKIVFLSLKQALDYFQIGGTESFARRLSNGLIQKGIEVDYILYGDKENRELISNQGITLKYFKSFDGVLNAIYGRYDHIVTIYLLPKDRLKYAIFRRSNTKSTSFHFIYFGWPDSTIKRSLYFSEARFFPYNGKLFCISQRQYKYVSRWADNAVYLLPPVPEDYFLKPEEKPVNDMIKITFLGRIDQGKGINEVIEIFNALRDKDKFECSIYGIHIPEHRESLKIHNRLRNQKEIKYIEVDRQKYSPAVDDFVKNILKETDIFIQPYQRLSSTIDTPLLLLEAMASLCVVVTKPFGNIPDVYGKGKFLVYPENFSANAIELLKNITSEDLGEERKRLYEQNLSLNYKAADVAKRFVDALNN